MKKLGQIISTLSLVAALSAPAAVWAKELKIGIVDFRKVMATSDEAKQVMQQLQQEFKPKQDKMIKLEKELKEKSEKLQRNAAIMSEAEKSKLEREVISAQRELQRLQEEFREDSIVRQQQETQKMIEKVSKVVQNIATKEQYDLVLHQDVNIYAADHIDITDKVIKSMKEGNK